NLMLGRIQAAHFPAVFGPRGDQRLDDALVTKRFTALAEEVAAATGKPTTPEAVAAGFRQVAVVNMANAIKKISIQRGHDITGYVLTTFGGAGGQHACEVADALGIRTVLVPPAAGGNMANAIKSVASRRGHDITGYVLATFGGAGGQHAGEVADARGIRTVLVPPAAGVLSALGIGLADLTVMREQSVEQRLSAE